MNKSKEQLAADLVEAKKKLEQEKKKPATSGKPKILL